MCLEPGSASASSELEVLAASAGADKLVSDSQAGKTAKALHYAFTMGDQSNAERTAGRSLDAYREGGVNSAGDGAHAGVALGKGEVRGGSVEVASASVQIGAQSEAQVGVARITMGDSSNAVQLRAVEAEAHFGVHNPDGSTGLNAGASANVVAAEATVGAGDNSVTVGASVGWGGEVSVGERDADNDGNTEYCARLSASLQVLPVGFVLGACVEPGGLYDAVTR